MMRPAVKHWLLLIFLVVSLAAMLAFALWQIRKARERPRPAREQLSSAAAAVSGHSSLARLPAGA